MKIELTEEEADIIWETLKERRIHILTSNLSYSEKDRNAGIIAKIMNKFEK